MKFYGFNASTFDLIALNSWKPEEPKQSMGKLWNALPLDIRKEDNIEKFKQKVKTLIFEGTAKTS